MTTAPGLRASARRVSASVESPAADQRGCQQQDREMGGGMADRSGVQGIVLGGDGAAWHPMVPHEKAA